MSTRNRTSAARLFGLMRLVLLASTALVSQASADDRYDQCIELSDGTNEAWSVCGGEYLTRLDGEMDAAWKRVFPSLTEEGQKLFYAEQRAWTAFKDSACLYLGNGDYGRGGQVLHRTTCQGKIFEERIQYLDELVDFVTIGGE